MDHENGSAALAKPERKYTPRSYDKLVGVDPQIILDRVAKGDLLREIAADYGCTQPAVTLFVQRHVETEIWASVREQSIAARLENSIQAIEQAEDQLMLGRAREAARLWMWRAERELPHLYGQRTQITHEVGPDLGEMLREARKRVSSAQPTAQLIGSGSTIPVDNTQVVD